MLQQLAGNYELGHHSPDWNRSTHTGVYIWNIKVNKNFIKYINFANLSQFISMPMKAFNKMQFCTNIFIESKSNPSQI